MLVIWHLNLIKVFCCFNEDFTKSAVWFHFLGTMTQLKQSFHELVPVEMSSLGYQLIKVNLAVLIALV